MLLLLLFDQKDGTIRALSELLEYFEILHSVSNRRGFDINFFQTILELDLLYLNLIYHLNI